MNKLRGSFGTLNAYTKQKIAQFWGDKNITAFDTKPGGFNREVQLLPLV